MNVRERAKTFEALMSGSSGSMSSENETKKSQEELMTVNSGSASSNGQKDSGGEKQKPIPPPRKPRKKGPTKPESPQLQRKIFPAKCSPEIQRKLPPDKPKTAPKKPTPPRPAPYKQLPSPSLVSHIPHAKTKELSASLSRNTQPNGTRESSKSRDIPRSPKNTVKAHSRDTPGSPKNTVKAHSRDTPGSPKNTVKAHSRDTPGSPKITPKTSSRDTPGSPKNTPKAHPRDTPGSPKNTPKAHPREPPTKPSRGSPKLSPRSSPKASSRGSPKVSSREVQLSRDSQKGPLSESQNTPKVNPKRPPPPIRTSSLTRKSRPPVPPKPKRPRRPGVGPERKSATIPRTGSVESKEAVSSSVLKDTDVVKDRETKPRSLTSPLELITSPQEENDSRRVEDQPSTAENGNVETCEGDKDTFSKGNLELRNDKGLETPQVNGIEETKIPCDFGNTEILSIGSQEQPTADLSQISNSNDEHVDKSNISSKDETPSGAEESDKSIIILENLQIEDDKIIINRRNDGEDLDAVDRYRDDNIESTIDEKRETAVGTTELEKESNETGDEVIVTENVDENLDILSVSSEVSKEPEVDSPKAIEGVESEISRTEDVEMDDNKVVTNSMSSVSPPIETIDDEHDNKEIQVDLGDESESMDIEREIISKSSEKDITVGEDANVVESGLFGIESQTETDDARFEDQQAEETCVDVEGSSNENDSTHPIQYYEEEKPSPARVEEVPSVENTIVTPEEEESSRHSSATEEVSFRNEEKDVSDIVSDVSEVSAIPPKAPYEEKRTSYLETSLDDEFFNEEHDQQQDNTYEDEQREDLNEKAQNGESEEKDYETASSDPYETEIDVDVTVKELPKDDGVDDRATIVLADVSESTAEEEDELKVSTSGNNENQRQEPNQDHRKHEGATERKSHYENIIIPSPAKEQNEEINEDEDLSSEPVKPSRPSRRKKQTNLYTYENASVIQAPEVIQVETGSTRNTSPKRTDVYENTMIVNQTLSHEEGDSQDLFEPAVSTVTRTDDELYSGENKQPSAQSPRYENVVFVTEEHTSNEDASVYEVPRRKSFHSESPTASLVRSPRSASLGSMERKKHGRNVMSKQTETEDAYGVPKSLTTASTSSDETYVAPRTVRTTSTEETYVAPRSIRSTSDADDVYVAPRSIRPTSTEQEDMYVAPRSIPTAEADDTYVVPKSIRTSSVVDPEDTYVAPRTIRAASSETVPISESEYHVPTSSSREEVPDEQYKVPKTQSSQSEEENGVYSVPVVNDSSVEPLFEEGSPRLRRSTRSSVLTSREQLPTSLKSVPSKPPRSSADSSAQQSENSKPTPIPRTSLGQTYDPTPRASPRPKPRHSQDTTKNAEEVQQNLKELPVLSQNNDQATASPKPKRPAPPRPKAPSFNSAAEKDSEENDSETKQKAAPHRPPPPLSRVSIISSEQAASSAPSSPVETSSESEDDEQPPVPIGPPKKKTYHIAHEILSTEKTFVKALSLCYEDCYGLIREADVVPETTLNDIFKDLGNIYQLDLKFLQELEERMETWDENERIGDIVKRYGHFLKMYTTYINHYDKAANVLKETIKENLQFAELVQQFQASEKCRGLFLESFMLKPVQRIPSYRLLLKDYLKHLPPDSDEFDDIKVALDIVSEVATHINESMKKVDNFERVLRIQESIMGNAEIVKPGREFIKEGTLEKLCRKDMQERTFFLLTDVLLYTSAVGGGQYKLKSTLPLLGIKVALPDSPEFENEFIVISKTRSFTLSASTQAERDEWIEELTNAITALTKKKSTFFKSKDGTVVTPDDDEDESKLGGKAPVWIQDTRVTMCMLCTDKFTVTNRRHHCRGCGKVVCGSCSDNLAPLAYLDYAQARVCEVCYEVLLKEQNKSVVLLSEYDDSPPHSPVGIAADDLDRIHRKPPKFEILHRFKPGSKRHHRRSKIFTTKPSVRTEVVGHDSESQMSGYLRFKRTNKHGWKRLWFVLKDNVLYTYKASEDIVAMETIPILGYVVQEATRTEGDEIQFQLKHAGLPPISFKTETESSAFRWTQVLRKATTL